LCFEVANCDLKRRDSAGGQLEHEIGWKALLVAFRLFIQVLGGDPVQLSEMGVEHDLSAADEQDERFDALEGKIAAAFETALPFQDSHRW